MLPLPQLLAELVRLPSVNPMGRTDLPPDILYESRVIARWEAELRSLGVSVIRQPVAPGRDNLIATFDGGGSSTILLEAHTDTVPVDGMTIDPFGGVIEGGKLFGRGACDVKGGGVAMYGAFRRLVQEKPANAPRVILAFTVDEEHTFLGAQELVKLVEADFAIVAEPTNLNIVRSHKGVVRWQIETTGRACHSSRPQDGANAVYRMGEVLTAIEKYAKELQARTPDATLGPRTLVVGMIHGGVSPNTVPDRCVIDIDRRLLPGESALEAIADLDRHLTGFECHSLPPKLACPPLLPKGGDAFVERLGAAIDRVRGRHEVWNVPYGTDASTIQEAGIPAVVFGPGDIAQAHTKDEWIAVEELDAAAEVLFGFLRNSVECSAQIDR